jgi:predicted nucleic acid-binding protein
MDVFDSNIWIYGLTRTCDDAVTLVEEAINTTYHVGVSAYIYDEVMLNLQRSEHDRETIERVQTRFADIVYGNETIHGPTHEEIKQMDVEAWRRDQRVQTMGEILGIQDKDVPIVVYARQCAQNQDSPTVIHTADHDFSQFDPTDYMENIVMRYVDCSTTA